MLPRVLGRLESSGGGPTLICIAGLHGNEPAGVDALIEVMGRLEGCQPDMRGRLVALTGNRAALVERRRFVDEDLNRLWHTERASSAGSSQGTIEAREQAELDAQLRPLLHGSDPVYLLDLHTTSAPGPAFLLFEDTLRNRAFAQRFPVPLVLGIEERLHGTLIQRVGQSGVVCVAFEAGQHDDGASIERAQAAIWIALQASGVLDTPAANAARELLIAQSRPLPRAVEVRYRHAVAPADRFEMLPGFASFDRIRRGQPVATSVAGQVMVPEGGLLLMPLYDPLGDDGFFLIREVRARWLRVSSTLRRLGMDRYVHWLPGVRPHPTHRHGFLVDRRIARWGAPELFHLLGFVRIEQADGSLVMVRRGFDHPD